jgi:hypothetical protein
MSGGPPACWVKAPVGPLGLTGDLTPFYTGARFTRFKIMTRILTLAVAPLWSKLRPRYQLDLPRIA